MKSNIFKFVLLLTVAIVGVSSMAKAMAAGTEHPVSIVEADIYVNRFKITMRLTCFAEDLELLQGVTPLEDGFYDEAELLDATVDHGKYLAEKITIRDADGERMKPRLVETLDIEFPDDGIKSGTLMNYPISFVFEFKYDQAPEFITIEQKMVAEGALLPSDFKVLMKQAGSDTPYMQVLKPEKPETFRFDWDAPVLSKDASEEEWEVWFEDQRKKTLGINSYSSVYSFIYINRAEVRHEVLIPLATLSTFLDIERADESFLDVAEQEAAAEMIKDFFSFGNPVTIDDIEVAPVFDRVDFYGLNLRDFAVQAEKRRVSMASGRVGIIMSYSAKTAPQKVVVTWDKFNEVMRSVSAVVFAYDKIEKTEFSKFLEDNTYDWKEESSRPLPRIEMIPESIDMELFKMPMLEIPLVTVAVCGLALLLLPVLWMLGVKFKNCGPICGCLFAVGLLLFQFNVIEVKHPFKERKQLVLRQQETQFIFSRLHANLFRSFDYHNESDIYDALANSVDGDLLREFYRQVNDSMRVQEQGGAVARIKEVRLSDGRKSDLVIPPESNSPGFQYQCRWSLLGTIEHWGHIHERKNEYEAKFTVRICDDAWKITEMDVINEEPGVVKTSLRKF